MRFIRAIQIPAAIALLLVGIGCGGSSTRDENSIVVGMELTYPPFEMRNTSGEPDGISVRMAEDLAASLGKELKIEDIAWDGIIPALQTKKIDLIISSMTRTPEREQTIDFSEGYVSAGLCMLVQADSKIQSAEDLKGSGAKVAVKLGTTGHVWAQSLEGVELIVLDEAAVCALEVAQKKADVFVYDQISVYKHWKNHEKTTKPILKPIRVETWAIGMRKGEDDLKTRVNEWLEAFRAAKKFDEIADTYMADEKRIFEEQGVPFIFH